MPERRISTAIRFPPDVHDRISRAAEERDLSINYLTVKAVEEFLAMTHEPQATADQTPPPPPPPVVSIPPINFSTLPDGVELTEVRKGFGVGSVGGSARPAPPAQTPEGRDHS